MKISKSNLTLIFLMLYLVGMVFSAFMLFNIKTKFIYDLHILEVSDSGIADSYLFPVFIVTGMTMFIGLITLYFSRKAEEAEVIYVEKTKEEIIEEEKQKEEEASKNDKISIQDIKPFLKGNKTTDKENLKELLSTICNKLEASQGAFFLDNSTDEVKKMSLAASYALILPESRTIEFEYGEGLVGQVAKENMPLHLTEIPEGYVKIVSGLGGSQPSHLLILPVSNGDKVAGILEIASFTPFTKNDINHLEKAMAEMGQILVPEPEETPEELAEVPEEELVPVKKKSKKKKTEDK